MCASGTTAAFGLLEPLEQASFTPQMEDSQSTAGDSSPACLGFGYLANSLAQVLDTALREFERDRDMAKAALVTASTLLQAEVERYSSANGSAVWRPGRCCACALLSIATCTAPFTLGISARLRSVARRTSAENSNSPLASRRMPTW
jgi:hypothetical protein